MPARIGVNDAPARIDQQHAGADAVEGVGEGCGLGCLQADHPPDQHRTADVRDDETHAVACLVVDQAIPLVAENREQDCACAGFVERGGDVVHQPLRPHPLLVEARRQELLVRHDVGGGDRLLDLGEEMAGRERVELCVFFDIELPELTADIALLEIHSSRLADGILGVERRRRAADEGAALAERRGPLRRIECRVVDVADQPRQLLIAFSHGTSSRLTPRSSARRAGPQ